MKKIAIALSALAFLAAASAHAEGLSIGGNLGSSHYKGDAVGGAETDRSDTGVKIYGGWSFAPNVAIEAGWADIGKFGSSAGTVKGNALFADLVGTLPLGYNVSALGRIGLTSGKLENSLLGSERNTNVKVGAGLQYDIDKNLGVRGEWERYRFKAFGTTANTDVYSVGVNYKF